MSNSILTYQVLLDLVKMLSDLQKDPEALEKAAAESYMLGVREEKRALAAKQDIVTNTVLIKQLADERRELEITREGLDARAGETATVKAAQESELAEGYRKLDASRVAFQEDVTQHKKNVSVFEARQVEAEAGKSRLQVVADGVNASQAQLGKDRDALEAQKAEIAKAWDEVRAYEKNLKDRAAKLRQQTEGL